MPRPFLGVGPERAHRIAVLRAVGAVLAVALGAVAVWLIVTSSSQKRIEIGILAGLWGLLIGAYCAFGSRTQSAPEPPVATMPAFDPAALSSGGGVLDVRPPSGLQRKEEVAARREFQARLEKVLRHEIQEGLGRELAGLRAEVAALRSELLEKVGGQLKLERIEITGLIGSDIEALHQEVRELKVLQGSEGEETETVTTVRRLDGGRVETTVASVVDREPAARPAEPVAEVAPEPVVEVVPEPEPVAEVVPEPEVVAEPEPVAEVVPEPEPVAEVVVEPEPEVVAEPEPVALVVPEPEPEPEPVAEPAVAEIVAEPEPEPEVVPDPDPDPEPEPEPEPELVAEVVREPEPVVAPAPIVSDDPFASMPRLSPFTDFEPIVDDAPAAAAPAAGSRRAGGRRYREDDTDDNVLARILQREGTRST